MRNKPIAKARVSVKNFVTNRGVRFKEPLRIFIDTGSSHSIIRADVVQALKKAGEFDKTSARLVTASGEKKAYALKDVGLCIESACYRGDALVLDNLPGQILLGGDFLAAGQCTVDFKKQVLKCGRVKIPFELEE